MFLRIYNFTRVPRHPRDQQTESKVIFAFLRLTLFRARVWESLFGSGDTFGHVINATAEQGCCNHHQHGQVLWQFRNQWSFYTNLQRNYWDSCSVSHFHVAILVTKTSTTTTTRSPRSISLLALLACFLACLPSDI